MKSHTSRQIQGPRHLDKRTFPSGDTYVWDETVQEWLLWKSVGSEDSVGSKEQEDAH